MYLSLTPEGVSPPSRRRGLIFDIYFKIMYYIFVASFAEAWIEIFIFSSLSNVTPVASFAEAWIEIMRKKIRKPVRTGRLLRGGVD